MKLLDPRGKPLTNTKAALAVFFMSDDGESWTPVKPKDVPEDIRSDPNAVGHLFNGEILENAETGRLYKAQKINASIQ